MTNGAQAAIHKAEAPVFDFDNLSWADSEEISITQARIRQASDGNAPEALTESFKALRKILSRVVVSIPAEWLTRDAPSRLAWSDPESFSYIRARKMQGVMTAMFEAQESEKNE